MLTYWEKRREQEERERIKKELKELVKLTFDEEAEDYLKIDKMSKLITNEQIESIKKLLRDRNNYQEIKNILDNLEENKVIDDLKRLVRDLGKSNMLEKSKIEEVIKDNDN